MDMISYFMSMLDFPTFEHPTQDKPMRTLLVKRAHIARIPQGHNTKHTLLYITLPSRSHSSKDKTRAALNRFAQRCLTFLA
jgi:hypothetical protein